MWVRSSLAIRATGGHQNRHESDGALVDIRAGAGQALVYAARGRSISPSSSGMRSEATSAVGGGALPAFAHARADGPCYGKWTNRSLKSVALAASASSGVTPKISSTVRSVARGV